MGVGCRERRVRGRPERSGRHACTRCRDDPAAARREMGAVPAPPRGSLRSRRCAVRSGRSVGRHHRDRVRAPYASRRRPSVTRHHRRDRGWPGIRDDLESLRLPRAVPSAARSSRLPARRQPRHRNVSTHPVRATAGVPRQLRPSGRIVRRAARSRLRSLRHRVRRRRPRPGARRARHPQGRSLRRLLRHVLRADLRRAPSGPAPHTRARLVVPGRGPRPVVPRREPRDRRGHPPLVPSLTGVRVAER